jgi:uncharacterized phage protein (TIGR02218 family)
MTLQSHLATGCTTVARCWAVTRRDGVTLGFTDHDRPLAWDDLTFRPESGLTAKSLVQATGLSVDNSEAMGVLSSDAISEADIEAGRYDGAEVRLWHVNWTDPAQRSLRFRGTLGEIRRGDGAFQAELRGLSEALNRPLGRLYQRTCGASLGDAQCCVATVGPGLSADLSAGETQGGTFRLPGLTEFAPGWFEHGRLTVLTGEGEGLTGIVRSDRRQGNLRVIELWQPIRATVAPADTIRLEPGCDRTARTCRDRFANIANFRGFPFIPGEDWLMAIPTRSGANDGGSLG